MKDRFEQAYTRGVALPEDATTTLEAIRRASPPAILNVTTEPSPPNVTPEEALAMQGPLPGQSNPETISLGGSEAIAVTAREGNDQAQTKLLAVTVRDERVVGLVFSTLDGSSIEELRPDVDDIFTSWRWE